MSNAEVQADEGAPPEIIPLALLDGYKVRWSRETVARDIVQNFFDEVEDFRQVTVEVDAGRGTVEVRGPSGFDLEYLRYIGATTKVTRRAAGGFGEGFKVCALVLVRDFHCVVTAGSRRWEIQPVLRPMKLGRELCYEVRTRPAEEAHPGSFVRIEGADARLCAVFAGAKALFRHPENPRLGRPIHVDAAAGIGVFEALDDKVGELYYRRQLRGTLRFAEGSALTFAFDARLDTLEGDRDRRDLALASPLVAAVAAGLPDEVLAQLIRRLRAYWHHGGKVLGALLGEARRRGLRSRSRAAGSHGSAAASTWSGTPSAWASTSAWRSSPGWACPPSTTASPRRRCRGSHPRSRGRASRWPAISTPSSPASRLSSPASASWTSTSAAATSARPRASSPPRAWRRPSATASRPAWRASPAGWACARAATPTGSPRCWRARCAAPGRSAPSRSAGPRPPSIPRGRASISTRSATIRPTSSASPRWLSP